MTLWRARSAGEPSGRGLPPSPNAAARCASSASISISGGLAAGRVVELRRLVELGLELAKSHSIGRPRLVVDQRASVASINTQAERRGLRSPDRASRADGSLPDQVERVEFPTGLGDQPRQVQQALAVPKPDDSIAPDRPHVTVAAEGCRPRGRRGSRRWFGSVRVLIERRRDGPCLALDCGEAQRATCRQRRFDQVPRQRTIARPVTRDEHPRSVDARAHHPESGAFLPGIALGVLEEYHRLVVPSRKCREEPSNAVDWSGADLSRGEPHSVGVRPEKFVDLGRSLRITDENRRLCQVGHPEQPAVVAGQEREPAHRQLIHLAARFVDVSRSGVDVRRQCRKHPIARVVRGQLMGALHDLAQAVLLPTEPDDREPVRKTRLPAVGSIAVMACRLEYPLRVLQPTLQQAQDGVHDAVVPLEDRLTKLEREPAVDLDFGTREAPVLTERGHDDQQVLIPGVASRFDQLADLTPKIRHLLEGVGSHGCRDVTDQRIEQGPFITDPASHCDRLAA